ncbi:MAG: NifB/NifX family molybdenum-iron cluster-binding protein [Candidatus Bathyarchaeota archaeon]
MKICVSASSDNIDAIVDSRFGRCPYFLIVETETMDYNAILNDSINAAHGAGIQASQTVVNMGVKVVITGNIGPNAFNVLSAAGIKLITGVSGSIRVAVEKYKNGQLQETTNPTVGGHFGIGKGQTRKR